MLHKTNTVKASHWNSIGFRYSQGYLLILILLISAFLISFVCIQFLSDQYSAMLNELLDVNQMFIDVENVNRYMYYYYTFLQPTNSELFWEAHAVVEESLESVSGSIHSSYSRELTDLCSLVSSYLGSSRAVVEALDIYTGTSKSGISTSQITALYNESQKIYNYVNVGFQNVYVDCLEESGTTYSKIQQRIYILTLMQVAVLTVAVALYLICYRWITKRITQPLNELTCFAKQVINEPAEKWEHASISTGNELELFANTFNEMLDTIHGQMEQIAQSGKIREQLQQAEIENLRVNAALQSSQMRLLQSRINPHFLYNTLNMIVQTARMEGAEETAELMEIAAGMLRYNLSKLTKMVTLAEELSNIRDYADIQERRFGQRYRFDFEADDACVNLDVPCLILQPLVENSITHGIGSRIEGGKVAVRIYQNARKVCIDVCDDGAGIDEPHLKQLLNTLNESKEDGDHIGLRNVYQRLRMHYGSDFGFSIASVPGNTVIHMELPWKAAADETV